MPNHKTIFITGAGSGIGHDSALALARLGHRVIAATLTAPQAEALQKVATTEKLPIESFVLDVTSEADRQKINNYDFDVLINNAGTGESGSLAEIPLERVRRNYEVNVFGPIALTQLAFKKFFKKNSGTVIFVSSLAGRVTIPFLAPYCMTKFSLSSGVEALRAEIQKVTANIHVCLVEPGAYHTGFNQENVARQFEWMNESSFFWDKHDEIKQQQYRYFEKLEIKSISSIVRQVVKAATSSQPKLRYSAPWWQSLGIRILRIFGK